MEPYAQKEDKRGFFMIMMMHLLLLGIVGKRNRLFQVGGTDQRLFSDPQKLRNCRSTG
jgi:hypothetical protein